MALINHAKREINAKIVYYGPEGAGKRKSLQFIYDRIKPSLRGDLKSPSSSGDSLFFFDFSPFENTVFGDYRLRFHVYTLPGKVTNPASWKMTLKGADGLVIVADASPGQSVAAQETISVLRGYLSAYGVGLHDIPCVLQLDKGSNPSHTGADGISATLDLPNMQVFFSDAASGEGVLETFSLLSREIMTRIGQDDALQEIVGLDLMPEAVDDAEVTAALLSLDEMPDQPVCEPIQVSQERSQFKVVEFEGEGEQPQVVLAGEPAVCTQGVVRVPLNITLGGATRRLVVSITIDQA